MSVVCTDFDQMLLTVANFVNSYLDPPQRPSNVMSYIQSVNYPNVSGEIRWDPVDAFGEVSYNITSPSINVKTDDTRVLFQIDFESAEENYTVTITAIRCGVSSNKTMISILENLTIGKYKCIIYALTCSSINTCGNLICC